jgi:hypothetical protein
MRDIPILRDRGHFALSAHLAMIRESERFKRAAIRDRHIALTAFCGYSWIVLLFACH